MSSQRCKPELQSSRLVCVVLAVVLLRLLTPYQLQPSEAHKHGLTPHNSLAQLPFMFLDLDCYEWARMKLPRPTATIPMVCNPFKAQLASGKPDRSGCSHGP
ncbi:unnamed protein product [Aspergillus oryzae]|nr:unnamed protein product [Aspergillus oryzae]